MKNQNTLELQTLRKIFNSELIKEPTYVLAIVQF